MKNATTETRDQIEAAEVASVIETSAATETFAALNAAATKSAKAYTASDGKAENARAKAATAACAASVDLWLLVADGSWCLVTRADGSKAYGKRGLEALYGDHFVDPLSVSLANCRNWCKAGALIEACKAAGIDPVTNVSHSNAIWAGIGPAAGSAGEPKTENIAQAVRRVILMRDMTHDDDGDCIEAAKRAAICDSQCGGDVDAFFAMEADAEADRLAHAEATSTPAGAAAYLVATAAKKLAKIENADERAAALKQCHALLDN